MKSPGVLWLLGGIVAAAALVGFLAFDSPRAGHQPPVQFAAGAPEAAAPAPAQPPIEDVLGKFRRNAGSGGDLIQLRRMLLANPAAGLVAVLAFLATGEDAATGQPFTVAADGTLSGAPTLRIFLLDLLGQLARAIGSNEGAAYSREVLAKKDSPDEWALALRNVAWAEPQSRSLLAGKMQELLAYEPWLTAPTAGLLEAFDVAAYTRDSSLLPRLFELAQTSNSAIERAATISLDRFADLAPLEVMNFLNANPAQLAERPLVRADYFAKADLANLAQREAVERYLDRPDLPPAERTKFLQGLLSPGSFVSDSLLQTARPPDDGAARYAGIAATATEWLTRNRFPTLQAELLQLRATALEP